MKRWTFETLVFSLLLSAPTALLILFRWIKCCFGRVCLFQILISAGEGVDALSAVQRKLAIAYGVGLVAAVVLIAIGVYWLFGGTRLRQRRSWRWMLGSLVFLGYSGFAYAYLDARLLITQEIVGRMRKTDFFETRYRLCSLPGQTEVRSRTNLVVLVVESLEDTFSRETFCGVNLLPRLSAIRARGLSFSGQRQVNGTGCTAMAQTGMIAGVPRLPIANRYETEFTSWLPPFRTPTLFELLSEAGYSCAYVQGCKLEFGSTDKFFAGSPRVRVTAGREFSARRDLKPSDFGYYGVHDDVMLATSRSEITHLAAEGAPFLFMGVTLDTHVGLEYLPPSAPHPRRSLLENVLLNTDSQVADFVEWIQAQPFASNTVVVVLGDHKYMQDLEGACEEREAFNLVWRPQGRPEKVRRTFAAFDWAPTFLELIGFDLPDGKMGLGTSLVHPGARTLLEQDGVEVYERESRKADPGFRDFVYRPY